MPWAYAAQSFISYNFPMRWVAAFLVLSIFLLAGLSLLWWPPKNSISPEKGAAQNLPHQRSAMIPRSGVSQVSGNDDSWGPEFYQKILSIQVAADKSHGSFISREDTKGKLDRVCNDFFSLMTMNFAVCELMLTNRDVGERMSEIIADYRYAENDQEKLSHRQSLIEIFAQLKGLAFTQNYISCQATGIKVLEGISDEHLEMGFDALEPGVNIGSHSFDSTYFPESIRQLIEQLDDKAKTHARDIQGIVVVQNHEREEIQTCPYVHRFMSENKTGRRVTDMTHDQ